MIEEPQNFSRAQMVYQNIRSGIRNGELRPGERLREVDLAARLAVSRTPVREAFNRLASDGLVTTAPSGGVMIVQLDKQNVRQIYSLRAVLEGASARLAAQHASPAEFITMRELLAACDPRLASPADMARYNNLYHQAIHDAARNEYLTKALLDLSDFIALMPGTTFESEARKLDGWAEHLEVLNAMEERRADDAERLARRHIENAEVARLRMMFAT